MPRDLFPHRPRVEKDRQGWWRWCCSCGRHEGYGTDWAKEYDHARRHVTQPLYLA